MSFQKEPVDCLICGGSSKKSVFLTLPWVVRCGHCGFVYNSPRITPQAARELYSREYFESHSSQQMGYDNYVSDQALVEKTFERRLQEIEKKSGLRGSVLDVGCATGFFLTIARNRGWQATGVEISDYCCRFAREKFGLDVHNGVLGEYSGGPFDLVTMWDYIEHSFVPEEDLEKAFNLLKPGGMLALATPDVGSWPAKLFGDKWIGFKEHEHLYYFDRKNLTDLLRRKGFEISHVSYAGKFISFDFFAKRAGSYSKMAAGALNAAARLPGLREKMFYCNPWDIVSILAKKPAA